MLHTNGWKSAMAKNERERDKERNERIKRVDTIRKLFGMRVNKIKYTILLKRKKGVN